jgi:hypothetical protein
MGFIGLPSVSPLFRGKPCFGADSRYIGFKFIIKSFATLSMKYNPLLPGGRCQTAAAFGTPLRGSTFKKKGSMVK